MAPTEPVKSSRTESSPRGTTSADRPTGAESRGAATQDPELAAAEAELDPQTRINNARAEALGHPTVPTNAEQRADRRRDVEAAFDQHAALDAAFWRTIEVVRLCDVAALYAGIRPDDLHVARLRPFGGTRVELPHGVPLLSQKRYAHFVNLAVAGVKARSLLHVGVAHLGSPEGIEVRVADLAAWARSVGLELPTELDRTSAQAEAPALPGTEEAATKPASVLNGMRAIMGVMNEEGWDIKNETAASRLLGRALPGARTGKKGKPLRVHRSELIAKLKELREEDGQPRN